MYDPAALDLLPGWTERIPPFDREYHAGNYPNHELTEAALRRVKAHYYATISHIDFQVGRLIAALHARGLYEETLIVFTSDHGEYLGYHHMLLKGGPMYEPLVRVPLLVKFPGNASRGERRETLASLIDLAPTLLRQAGLAPAAGMIGLDLADPTDERAMVFAEDRRGARLMARSATGKLILGPAPGDALFFDLAEDPYELTNRFEDTACREEVERHREALTRWALFEALPPVCLDATAATIRQANVTDAGDDHREKMRLHSEQKVAEYLGSRPIG
jgi:arylsulfatase A-like enzyme